MKRNKDTRAIIKACNSEGRPLLTQKERDYIACAYASSFDEGPGKGADPKRYRDAIERKLEHVMSVLDSDLIVDVEWLRQIVGEINERSRKR